METFVKKGNKLIRIGEGKLFKKGELMIKEDSAGVDANIGTANGIQQAQMKAKQLMNKNPGVNSASADAGKLDGQSDSTCSFPMRTATCELRNFQALQPKLFANVSVGFKHYGKCRNCNSRYFCCCKCYKTCKVQC